MEDSKGPYPVLPPALALFTLGLPGILALFPFLPRIPGVPRAALLIDPLLFLALAALIGAQLAPRCGFRSLTAERVSSGSSGLWPADAGKMLAAGVALGVVVTLADDALGPLWQTRPAFPPSLVEAWSPTAFAIGMLYGGVVEEILMRWGLMSLFVWLLWRIFMRHAERPPRAAVLAGLVLAALVFAASHLPELIDTGAEMTPPLVIRTIGFNAILGLAFGWFFARRNLESAMLAHTSFHIGVACAALPMRLAL